MIGEKRKTGRKTHMEKGKNYGIRHLALLTGENFRKNRSGACPEGRAPVVMIGKEAPAPA